MVPRKTAHYEGDMSATGVARSDEVSHGLLSVSRANVPSHRHSDCHRFSDDRGVHLGRLDMASWMGLPVVFATNRKRGHRLWMVPAEVYGDHATAALRKLPIGRGATQDCALKGDMSATGVARSNETLTLLRRTIIYVVVRDL